MNDVAKLLKRAQKDYANGNRRGARNKYEQALSVAPRHLDANYLLGTLLAESGELELAEVHLKTALAVKPDSGFVLMNLGSLCRLSGRERQALEYYERAEPLLHSEPAILVNLGSLECKLGHYAAAQMHLTRYLIGRPDDNEARVQLGDALRCQGRLDDAALAYRQVITASGSTPTLEYLLSCCTGEAPDCAPESYVCGLFDNYAKNFDQHLMGELECRIPEAIFQTVLDCAGEQRFGRAADLGCGTGLTGAMFRSRCDWLAGVDLSPKMVELARTKQVYDLLEVADVCAWTNAQQEKFELMLAGDVAIYLGNLAPLLTAVSGKLSSDGLFAFSAEDADHNYVLRPSGRYAHNRDWVERQAALHGLTVLRIKPTPLRKESGQWVDGYVAVLGLVHSPLR